MRATKTRPALMTREQIAAAFAAAVERRDRERPNDYRSYTEAEELQAKLDGRKLERVPVTAPVHKDAETSGQWWDDRLLERNNSTWWHPDTPVMFAVAVAARDGGRRAAVEAVRAARQLEPAAQWDAWRNLRTWRGHPLAVRFGAEDVLNGVLAEWERLRLATEEPDDDEY